jgi:hypothetical protein
MPYFSSWKILNVTSVIIGVQLHISTPSKLISLQIDTGIKENKCVVLQYLQALKDMNDLLKSLQGFEKNHQLL